jgi:2-amino-4-hydroxy-6-hydroxymethyldihydropteridine diphosphokinase
MKTPGQEYLIALGANLRSSAGVPQQTLHEALAFLIQAGAQIDAVSRFFRTPCFPPGAGPDYVNAAARMRFDGPPHAALALLHEAEAEFGRTRVQRWGQRTLDLDLLAAEATILPDPQTHERWRGLPLDQQIETAPDKLILPHPRIQDRAFVLVPLRDIAPNWVHPVTSLTVTQMCDALPSVQVAEVVPL